MFKKIIVFIFILLLSACASVKKAGVVYHDNFDFSKVKSYSLYGRNSLFGETQSLLDVRRNTIEIAIEQTMTSKEFIYQSLDKTDLIVTYHVFTGNRHEFAKYNEAVRFCTPCLRATTWKTDHKYAPINQGNLILDLIDTKQNRSVWRSAYPLNIKIKENSADTHDKITQAVSTMLAQYPK